LSFPVAGSASTSITPHVSTLSSSDAASTSATPHDCVYFVFFIRCHIHT
jgi:hypothetical protein